MSSSAPLVSICMPTLNARKYLEPRMDTILAQTFTDWELIVCDSHSSDGTWEFLSGYRSDPRVRCEQVPKEGLYAGWNEALRRARGEYIYIATADDTMEEHCLERLTTVLSSFPDVDMVISEAETIDPAGNPVGRRQPLIWQFLHQQMNGQPVRVPRAAFFLLLAGFAQGIGSVTGILFRKRLLEKSGLFPTDLLHLGDAEWALRASLATDVIALPEKLATWREHEGQASYRFDLNLALVFRKSLERVLDDRGSGIPTDWRTIPSWRDRLTKPRHRAAILFSGLFRYELRKNWHRFPGRLLDAWRRDPSIFWERVLCLFGFPATLKVTDENMVLELLETFPSGWPPVPVALTRSPAGQQDVPAE